MSDSAHLLIPFASSPAPGCRAALAGLALPRLEQLLARLAAAAPDAGDERTLSTPHERALARACALPAADGRIPWAAWELRQAGGDPGSAAWAQVTPCHWRVGSDHVAMEDPAQLQLQEAESRALLAAVRPFFEEDGIALQYVAPTRWLARAETFRDFPAASLDRVIGRTVDAWLPRFAGAGAVRRLQQEVQMLLYTDETNEDRQRRGLHPVNSFWVSGTGVLPGAAARAPDLRIAPSLRGPALAADWTAWAAAWREIDERECPALLQALAAGQTVTLTLAGERHARSWSGAGGGWRRRLAGMFGRPRAAAVLEAL